MNVQTNSNIIERNFQILHLNINSIQNNLQEIDEILNSKNFDLLFFSETKLDDSIPNSFYNNKYYKKIRLDRNRHGGGLIIFVKNSLSISRSLLLEKSELIYLQIKIKTVKYNFIHCYRSPVLNENIFLERLEDFIHNLNLDEPLFIIGDLNMDLLSDAQKSFKSFIDNNDLINFITSPTRIATRHVNNNQIIKRSETLIDVLLHNGDLIDETSVIKCSFSDHCFITAKLSLIKPIDYAKTIICRNLSIRNLSEI